MTANLARPSDPGWAPRTLTDVDHLQVVEIRICEQAHQQSKEELGLDHFDGRSWTGLHRHFLMTMIASAFLQARRLKAAGRKEESADRRPNRACQLLDKPFLTSSRVRHPANALTVRSCSQTPLKPKLPK